MTKFTSFKIISGLKEKMVLFVGQPLRSAMISDTSAYMDQSEIKRQIIESKQFIIHYGVYLHIFTIMYIKFCSLFMLIYCCTECILLKHESQFRMSNKHTPLA